MKTRVKKEDIPSYIDEHIPYRLNSLRAYDIYLKSRTAKEYREESERNKCYWESEFLEPALKFQYSLVEVY